MNVRSSGRSEYTRAQKILDYWPVSVSQWVNQSLVNYFLLHKQLDSMRWFFTGVVRRLSTTTVYLFFYRQSHPQKPRSPVVREPMTLKFECNRGLSTVYSYLPSFFNRSEVIVLSSIQTNKQTNKHINKENRFGRKHPPRSAVLHPISVFNLDRDWVSKCALWCEQAPMNTGSSIILPFSGQK